MSTMLILLRGTGAVREFFVFAFWFGVIPIVLGLLVFYLLYRKDRPEPEEKTKEEPEWKKYIRRG